MNDDSISSQFLEIVENANKTQSLTDSTINNKIDFESSNKIIETLKENLHQTKVALQAAQSNELYYRTRVEELTTMNNNLRIELTTASLNLEAAVESSGGNATSKITAQAKSPSSLFVGWCDAEPPLDTKTSSDRIINLSHASTTSQTTINTTALTHCQHTLSVSETERQQLLAENSYLRERLAAFEPHGDAVAYARAGVVATGVDGDAVVEGTAPAVAAGVVVENATILNNGDSSKGKEDGGVVMSKADLEVMDCSEPSVNDLDDVEIQEEAWTDKFEQLKRFHYLHGHFHTQDPTLTRWVQRQRSIHRSRKGLDAGRRNKLESIGFFQNRCMNIFTAATACAINTDAAACLSSYDPLTNGIDVSSLVPISNHTQLTSNKVRSTSQQNFAKQTPIPTLSRLTKTVPGIISHSDEKWEEHFNKLQLYKKQHGTCLVPTSTELGRWLCRQRYNYRNKGLKESRKMRLMELDNTCLGERLSDLKSFSDPSHSPSQTPEGTRLKLEDSYHRSPNPNCDTSNTLLPQPQKKLLHKTKYNQAYESKLHQKWSTYYDQLRHYKSLHGHCNYPTMNGSLGRWISRQRTLYRAQKLKSDRYHKLAILGFAFEDAPALEFQGKLDEQWEAMYMDLWKHKQKTGHCFDVPETDSLGKWLYRQRWLFRNGNLRKDRTEKLLALGFDDKKVLKKDTNTETSPPFHTETGDSVKRRRTLESVTVSCSSSAASATTPINRINQKEAII